MENLNSIKIEDKRRFKRVEGNFPLQYKNLRKTGDPAIEATTRNISEGGVCFNSKEFISLACRMVVEIALPTSPKPIKAITKVAWIKRVPSGEHYELGNQFLDMAKEDKTHVVNFINKVMNTSI